VDNTSCSGCSDEVSGFSTIIIVAALVLVEGIAPLRIEVTTRRH
jgi:hypothetical protein